MVLILDGEVVVFNYVRRGMGDSTVGIERTMEIHNLIIPPELDARQEEIKQLLCEALE
jgi:hypothetical protein